MNLLVTGTGQPLADLAISHFAADHKIIPLKIDPQNDWCDPDRVRDHVSGVDMVLHLVDHNQSLGEQKTDGHVLDLATRSTYVLMDAAREEGIDRVIFASTLDLFRPYPQHYVIDESWQPRPLAQAESLTPYLVEICCREFARQGGISVICLRFGGLGKVNGTSETAALAALDGSMNLELDPLSYRWQVFHVSSSPQFPMVAARKALNMELA